MSSEGKAPSARVFLKICHRGDVKKLKSILSENGDDLDWSIYRHTSSGDTGLHLAAQEGHTDVVKLLLESKKKFRFNVNVANFEGKRPLHCAAQNSHVDVVKLLISEGALVNTFKKADWTPLMLACTKSGPQAKACIQALHQANADPFLCNKDGWTAFLVACRTGDCEIIDFCLLNFDPKCIDTKSKNGRNILHIIAFHGHLNALNLFGPKCLHLLNASDSTGTKPIHESVKCSNPCVTKRLIELGADVRATDHLGQTILHIAAIVGKENIIQCIIDETK